MIIHIARDTMLGAWIAFKRVRNPGERSLTRTVLLGTWRIVLIHFIQEGASVPAKLTYDVFHHVQAYEELRQFSGTMRISCEKKKRKRKETHF